MLSSWIICSVSFWMLSDVSAFTPTADYQCASSLGSRTAMTKRSIEGSGFYSRSMIGQDEREFSRNSALAMATKLQFSDDENGMTNSTMELSSRVESFFPNNEIVTIVLEDHVPLGCTVEESLHEEDDFIFISKLTKNGNAEKAGLKVGDVVVGVTGLFGELACTIDSDVEKM